MFILGVFVNLWAVITVYTFYSVFIYVTIKMSVLILFTVTSKHFCIYTLQDSQHFTNIR